MSSVLFIPLSIFVHVFNILNSVSSAVERFPPLFYETNETAAKSNFQVLVLFFFLNPESVLFISKQRMNGSRLTDAEERV